MRKLIILVIFISSIITSCNNIDEKQLKGDIQKKVLTSLNCESNSKVLNVSVSNLNISDNLVDFSGTFKAEFGAKYNGTFNGLAKIVGSNIEIKSLKYTNALIDLSVSEACLN